MFEIIIPTLTVLAVLAVGLFFTYLASMLTFENLRSWRQFRESRGWPSVSGLVESSEIMYEGAGSPSGRPNVRYHYQVNGTDYTGQRIDFSLAQVYTTKESETILARYPLHGRVTVYYDPANPAECALEQLQSGRLGGLLLGLLVFLPACLCLATGLIGLSDVLRK